MGNPNPSPETRFKPGQAANPGGRTSEGILRDKETADKASKLRNILISRVMETLDDDPDAPVMLSGELLRLLKDSEDRAHGTPKASTEITGDAENPIRHVIERRIVSRNSSD